MLWESSSFPPLPQLGSAAGDRPPHLPSHLSNSKDDRPAQPARAPFDPIERSGSKLAPFAKALPQFFSMLPQFLLHEPFAPLPPTEALILAFYALSAALQPTGVLLVCDTANLGDAVVAIDSLAPSTQLQLALHLLENPLQSIRNGSSLSDPISNARPSDCKHLAP